MSESNQGQETPAVRIFLERDRYAGDGARSFAPLRLPEQARFDLDAVSADLVVSAEASFCVALRAGEFGVPIAGGTDFVVCARPGTQASGRLEIARRERPGGAAGPETLVTGVDLSFEPALELPNVIDTLVEVQDLFEDRVVSSLLRSVSAAQVAARLREVGANLDQRLLGGAVFGSVIALERVCARPKWRTWSRRWDLELAFSGRVRVGSRLRVPFSDVVLPHAILPVPYARLSKLLGHAPFATGSVHASRLDEVGLLRTALAVIERVEGRFDGVADAPAVEVHATMVDRTRSTTRVDLGARVRVAGPFSVTTGGMSAAATFSGLRLEAGQGEGAVEADASARVTLDLDTPDLETWERVQADLAIALRDGARLGAFGFSVDASHPLAEGRSGLRARLGDVGLSGALEANWNARAWDARPVGEGLAIAGRFELPDQCFVQRARSSIGGSLAGGRLQCVLSRVEGGWRADLKASADGALRWRSEVAPVAELLIEDSHLRAGVTGHVALDGHALVRVGDAAGTGLTDVAILPGGTVTVVLQGAEAELDGRRLVAPEGTLLLGRWREGEISSARPDDLVLDVGWDLRGGKLWLYGLEHSASILTRELREGELSIRFAQGGRIAFEGGRDGLYGIRFFNALLDPGRESEHLLEILRNDDAMARVEAVLRAFNPELGDHFATARRQARKVRDAFDAEGITRVGDAIPRRQLARLLSRVLMGDRGLEERLIPLIASVTDGRGLDLWATKDLLRPVIGERRLDYEVDGLLRFFDLVTAPSEAMPRASALAHIDAPPLVEDPRYAEALATVPSAAELYAGVALDPPSPALLATLDTLCTRLGLTQLDHVLTHARPSWGDALLLRLHHVREAKRRVARLSDGYGGMAFAAQSVSISSFLGEAVGRLDGPGAALDGPDDGQSWPPPCALGPRDVAALLQAGLVDGHQGMQAQINNRLLFELLRARPGEFTRDVLVEMSQGVPRLLSSVLFAILHQDQDELAQPIDLVALLSAKLGHPVPRQSEYMAGGRKVRQSYFEALQRLADHVFADAGPYLAQRAKLRDVRHPLPAPPSPTNAQQALARDAQALIAEADQLAFGLSLSGRETKEHERARQAYRRAFDACAALLAGVPAAFQEPWFRAFWARNEEALKVLSCVRSHEEDLDEVRRWLAVVAGRKVPDKPQALVEAIVHALWYEPDDRATLLGDPLVRLLIDEPPARYDFTIVSAMGVVTDGQDGRELEETYRRIAERRGVQVVRAHTGLFRSHEYNAAAIIRAASETQGHWGTIGYSQGCSNALLAESFLWCGTPEMQEPIGRFVARNLLFSAANGSAHGSSGELKFLRGMVEGERFLKHYQAFFSGELVEIVLRALRSAMDSHTFVHTFGGAHSLSLERARQMHRDRQFVPWVPTSSTRGVVTPDRLPEALEYLYFVHRRLLPDVPCDSQVPAEEAVGHATRVRNAWTDAFARCDMGSMTQSTHHWSPLLHEVAFVETDRDRERAVYHGPKDRHVFPWVEVNARFGRIGKRA